ncbi:ABC transporter ATP-binding protein [Salinibacter ruber]|uniref:ABC transporter ATP-binding protein n=1 Tax=Salinibacter ruber TaxID=146919 RepID=UPI0021673DD2|nr:ABC transporter ATP-binding protein [Salinibacter ruber]
MEVIKILFDLLTPRERRHLVFLFCAVLVMASLQVVSVVSIMPFLSVAADPASVHENVYLSWTYQALGFEETESFLIFLGLGSLTALLLSNAFIVLTTWALYRYAWGRNHSLSWRLLRSYLHHPYEYFLTRNSSELSKNILQEVKSVISGMLIPALRGMAKGIVALFIIGFLVFMDPLVALSVAAVLGCSYAAVYFLVRSRLDKYGEKRVEAETDRYQSVSEALGGIKEVKLRGKESTFLEQYIEPSELYARYQTRYQVIKKAPRYLLEGVAFGGIILIAVYLIAVRESIQQVIPMLGLYAFAGYRLMPALQQAFQGVASAHFNIAALKAIRRGMQDRLGSASQVRGNGRKEETSTPLTLENNVSIDGIYFTYPNADEPAIKNLSVEIPANTTLGFVGKTGSGKTTAVDIILGLLRPQRGEIRVDGTPVQDTVVGRWQQNVGYVPQQIYLSDDTVARNIAFGVPEDQIDIDVVKDAARRAHIFDFVNRDLPDKWNTFVGERGVKLSGGQRQRIGIARALYHNPSVLVFDEATSALDQATEASVMEAIYDLEGDHTMLMIAHRLSTVKRADNIVMLEKGRKVGEGAYEELRSKNKKFKSMVLS